MPKFDDEVMTSGLPIRKAVAKTVKLFHGFTDVTQLWKHRGLNFEKIQGYIDPETGEQLYSIRITQSARAMTCLLNGQVIVLVSLGTEHDKAYRKHISSDAGTVPAFSKYLPRKRLWSAKEKRDNG